MTELTDDEQRVVDQLEKNARGFQEKVSAGNIVSAFDELLVAEMVLRAARSTSPDEMTEERIELIARLAWAMAELVNGYDTRVPDDLEGVESLAQEVSEQ